MNDKLNIVENTANRRSFIKKGLGMAGAVATGGALLSNPSTLFGEDGDDGDGGEIGKGDIAILRFLSAVEQIESDLWLQYAELGGTPDTEFPGLTGGSAPYISALQFLDPDMPQYIHDNTEDEFSHHAFLNAYLHAKGAEPVDLTPFRNLPGSTATGSQGIKRLTNLMQLTVDTSWWTRYRSRANNPDLDPSFVFPQAVPSLSSGQFPAIPRTDADLAPGDHIQAIANTAGFHFAFIEQGGSSLYPSLALRVSHPQVLRILLSIGPTETSHFQTWHDKAGNAKVLTDPTNPNLVFPNLNTINPPPDEDFQTNLIMPEPCPFLSRKFPPCSIIRPTKTKGAAMGAVTALTQDGLFIGQEPMFFELMQDLAQAADAAKRGKLDQ